MAFTLYNYVLSANCYKVRLLANLLNVEYETVAVDFHPGQEHKQEALLQLNPAATLPIMVTAHHTMTETQAMLVWLAQTYDADHTWWPIHDPDSMVTTMQYLGFSSRLTSTLGALRQHTMLNMPIDLPAARANSIRALRELENHLVEQRLRGQQWLAGTVPTIADIACFPYTALSPDAGIEHDDYPAIRSWLHAVRSLDGFITMPGIYELHEQRDPAGKVSSETTAGLETASSVNGNAQAQ